MGGMKDRYFGDRPYPATPGWSEPTTSKAAARSIGHRAGDLRDRVLTALREAGDSGLTADEAAAALRESVLAVRPRLTELKGKIEPTGERRANASGLSAKVWRIAREM